MNAITLYKSFKTFMCLGLIIVMFSFTNTLAWRGGGGGGHGGGGHGGGAHHTGFSQAITAEYLEDFAEMADIEYLLINDRTQISEFKKELRWNEASYRN